MSLEPPDPTLYVRAPVMTAEAGITLSRALFAACAQNFPPAILKSAAKVNATADKAQSALALRQKALGKIPDDAARLVDQAGDASWSGLRLRLLGFAELPVAKYPDAKRAAELVTILFGPDGLSFLKETFPVQWTTADTILKRIDEEELEKDIDRIAGKVFLDNIRAQHEQYGAMVQGILLREQAEGVNLADHVRAMGRAIVEYATKVCASVDEDDESSITAARSALRPLDAYREAAARRGNNTQPPVTPETTPPG